MTQPGLMRIAPELVDTLRQCADETRHRIVERACLLAVRRTDAAAPQITEALEALRRRSFGVPELRARLDALTQQLDEIAWDVQDRVEEGDAAESEYRRCFRKARAVAAIGSAVQGSLAASFDSLYEAYYAIDNRDEFMRVVAD